MLNTKICKTNFFLISNESFIEGQSMYTRCKHKDCQKIRKKYAKQISSREVFIRLIQPRNEAKPKSTSPPNEQKVVQLQII